MKNRSHFTAPFLINNQLLDGIAAKVLKDYNAKAAAAGNNKSSGSTSSQLLAKPTARTSQKQLDERPWDRAGVGAESLSNQQRQAQLAQNCFRGAEDGGDLPSLGGAGGGGAAAAGAKELDALRKVVLAERGRPSKEAHEEELREQREKKEEKRRAIDDENSKIGAVTASSSGGGSSAAPASAPMTKKGGMSLLEEEMAKKKKKKGKGGAAPAAPVRERVVEMAEGVEDYEAEERDAKRPRAE